jgi:hypothetical protein
MAGLTSGLISKHSSAKFSDIGRVVLKIVRANTLAERPLVEAIDRANQSRRHSLEMSGEPLGGFLVQFGRRRLSVDPDALLRLLHRWREEAIKAGCAPSITR